MNEIQSEINSAFTILSSAMVSGDLVDVIAAAKMSLRRAWQLAADQESKDAPEASRPAGTGMETSAPTQSASPTAPPQGGSQSAPGETEGGHE